MKSLIKTGDKVIIIAGDNKGKTAKVVKMDRKNNKAMLEGIGVITRHLSAVFTIPRVAVRPFMLVSTALTLKK